MSDFFEIDFLDVKSKKSGDAIPLRYSINGITRIHITDGGFQDTGDKVVQHVKRYYYDPNTIDAVIVSHSDGDHAGGLRKVLETFNVSELWMLRPWLYADELIDQFARFSNVENLVLRLKEVYPNIAALEEIAESKGIPIREPFQGEGIGEFIVLAPTKERYLDLVVESKKTPEAARAADESDQSMLAKLGYLVEKVVSFIRAAWGEESFSSEETSPENEMSVIQYANLCGDKILLTADAGRGARSCELFSQRLRIMRLGPDWNYQVLTGFRSPTTGRDEMYQRRFLIVGWVRDFQKNLKRESKSSLQL